MNMFGAIFPHHHINKLGEFLNLNLASNQFFGDIPPGFDILTNLKTLCLNTNFKLRNLFMEKQRGKELNWKKTNFNKIHLDLNMSCILENLIEQNAIRSGTSGKVYNDTLLNGKEVGVKNILKKRN